MKPQKRGEDAGLGGLVRHVSRYTVATDALGTRLDISDVSPKRRKNGGQMRRKIQKRIS